ncbi:MAG TPA: phosphotransferase, partial [Chloroflexota bacterium]|nr:phosphotransferase [Chloroflexota bacterium]
PPGLCEAVRACLELVRTRGVLASVGPESAVLVHRDFQFRNVLAADGHLSGVLDFDKAEAGDPARDYAVLYPGDVALVREGYEERRLGALGERFRERLSVYRLLGALERLWHDEEAGRVSSRAQTYAEIRRLAAALSSEPAG